MSYAQKFKVILKSTLIGIAIGIALCCLMFFPSDVLSVFQKIGCSILAGIPLGFVISIPLYAKMNGDEFSGTALGGIWFGIKSIFFGNLFGSSFFFVIGIFKLVIGGIVLIAYCIFMSVYFFFNFIYLAIMSILEKKLGADCGKFRLLVGTITIALMAILGFVLKATMAS